MPAPIALFVFNRPTHAANTLQHLAACEGASRSDLYIFADGPRPQSPTEAAAVEETRAVCRAAKGFASVTLCEREQNMGLAANITGGVGDVLAKHGRIIVLEDDIEVAPFFLRYMNSALDFYENRGVFSISGYTPELVMPRDYQFSTYVMHRNCSWGWGTWAQEWDKVDWEVKSFDSFIRNARQRSAFNECGNDLTPFLLRWKKGAREMWDIVFCYAGFVHGRPTVYPRKSLVRNAGTDGTGSHAFADAKKYSSPLAANVSLSAFVPGVAPNQELLKQFHDFYSTSTLRLIYNTLMRWRYILFGK